MPKRAPKKTVTEPADKLAKSTEPAKLQYYSFGCYYDVPMVIEFVVRASTAEQARLLAYMSFERGDFDAMEGELVGGRIREEILDRELPPTDTNELGEEVLDVRFVGPRDV